MKTTKKTLAFQNRALSRNEMKKIIGGVAAKSCQTDADCPTGRQCQSGECQAKSSIGTND